MFDEMIGRISNWVLKLWDFYSDVSFDLLCALFVAAE